MELLLIVSLVTIASGALYWFVRSKKDKHTRVTALHIFPVKSIRGFSAKEWPLDEYGLAKDRNWMIVRTNNHKFLTQREMPKMALMSASLSTDLNTLTLSAPNCNDLVVSEGSEIVPVEIWKSQFNAVDMGNTAAEWLSAFLNTDVRLVKIPPSHNRESNPKYLSDFLDREPKPCLTTGFADGFPLLLGAEESLYDLNKYIKKENQKPIEMIRFRPNIVVNGQRPYEEDEWDTVKIGDLTFYNVKPCTRCTIPNVNPREGKKDTSVREILDSYRHSDELDNPLFAINLVHAVSTVGKVIRVGDQITVEKWQKAPITSSKLKV
jgi:hypothetical protein